MKLLKPSWVNHADNSIFSIDVHPDGSRFATGGQGQDSGKIIIWNMGPVIDKTKETDEKLPKILCQMDHHIACVNVVRWSNNGLFLASGSDDKLIMIWQYVHGGMAYQNIENWKCGFTLRGHSGDVMDLAWSAKDQYLATCSVDNTVIIWNALKFPDIISRINAHAGLVKGVAWDPVGIYFASQSDDKTLKIWRTLDWSLEKSIDEPFKQCAGTTHVLRLNWSPDGQLIISAHAINNGAPTAQSIDRGNKWSTKLDFVGHRKAVTAVRFFPQILKPFEAKNSNTADFKTHCLFALGSRDRSISIWLTNYSRPLCVVQDLFDNPIMDLSWSKHPKPGLLACSMDGTVSYIEFDYEEIGYPLSRPEVEDFFMKKYNHDINATVCLKPNNINQQMNQQQQQANTKKEQSFKFIENLDILMAQEEKQKQQQQLTLITNENSNTQFTNSLTATPSKHNLITENQKQIERRMPDGRRRITPICVCKPGEYDTPKPFGSEDNFNKEGFEKSIGFGSPNDVKIVSKTATEQSTIIVEKRDERNEIVEISPVKSIVYSKQANLNNSNTNNSNSNDITIVANKQPQTLTATTTSENIPSATPSRPSTPQITKSLNGTAAAKLNEIIPLAATEKLKSQEIIKTITSAANNSALSVSSQNQTQSKPMNSTPNISSKSVTKLAQSTKQSNQGNQQQPQHNTSAVLSKQKQSVNSSINNRLNSTQPMDTSEPVKPQHQSSVLTKMTTPSKASDHTAGSPHHGHSVVSHHLLSPLKIDKKFTTKIICDKTSTRSSISLEIHNSISLYDLPTANQTISSTSADSEYQLNLIKYLVDYKLKWQVYLTKKICEVSSSSMLLACVCMDSTIHFYKTSNGTQLCCPIILDSRAAVLKCNTNYCMCLTVSGFVYVWKYEYHTDKQKEMNNVSTIINRQSCQSILKDGIFMNALLTDHGVPVIYMSKNRSYFYSFQTECWHLVPSIGNLIGEDSQLLFNSSSLFSDHSKSMKLSSNNNDDIMGPLSIIQSKDKSTNLIKTIELINKTSLSENPLFNQNDYTLTHLESQVNASVGLNSPKEYKFWLITYARYLIENDYEDKLTDLCNFLLGPLYSSNWNDTILNFKKRDLLKEILTIVAQNLKFQRLHSYYKQQMNLLTQLTNPVTKNNLLNRLKAPHPLPVITSAVSTTPILNEESNLTTVVAPQSSQSQPTPTPPPPPPPTPTLAPLPIQVTHDLLPKLNMFSQEQEEQKQEIMIESDNTEQMDVVVAVIDTSEESQKKSPDQTEKMQETTTINNSEENKILTNNLEDKIDLPITITISETAATNISTTDYNNTAGPLTSIASDILMNTE